MGSRRADAREVRLGTAASGAPVLVDVDRLLETRLLVTANSGGGKSWLLRRLLEQTHGMVPQIVLDPEGEFHTLRDRFDFVLAGRPAGAAGDCPAEVRSAGVLARRLIELQASAVVDICELRHDERVAFVRVFLEALINLPRELWRPAMVVLDEAHLFCPETGADDAASTRAVIDLMTRGRKRGLCGVLATQRLSRLHKSAAAEANNVLIGRTALDVDLKRAGEALGLAPSDRAALKKLAPGAFRGYGPAIADGDVVALQVDGVTTRHPKAGQGAAAPAPPRATVRAILGQLADLPAEAAAEARTVAELQARVRDLERQVAAKPVPRADADSVSRAVAAEASARDAAHRRATRELLGQVESGVLAAIRAVGAPALARPPDPPPPPPPAATPPRPAVAAPARAPSSASSGPEQRLLNSLAWWEQMTVAAPGLPALAFVAGYSPKSSSFEKARGALRTKGLVQYEGDSRTRLTEAGRAAAVYSDAIDTNEQLHAAVARQLDGVARRLFTVLVACPDRDAGLSLAELAAATGYSAASSSFEKARGRLRSLGLADYPRSGWIAPVAFLFPESRHG